MLISTLDLRIIFVPILSQHISFYEIHVIGVCCTIKMRPQQLILAANAVRKQQATVNGGSVFGVEIHSELWCENGGGLCW